MCLCRRESFACAIMYMCAYVSVLVSVGGRERDKVLKRQTESER